MTMLGPRIQISAIQLHSIKSDKKCKKSECINVFHIDDAACKLHAFGNTIKTGQGQAIKRVRTKLTTLLYHTSKLRVTNETN